MGSFADKSSLTILITSTLRFYTIFYSFETRSLIAMRKEMKGSKLNSVSESQQRASSA